jgi:hypothetical protein
MSGQFAGSRAAVSTGPGLRYYLGQFVPPKSLLWFGFLLSVDIAAIGYLDLIFGSKNATGAAAAAVFFSCVAVITGFFLYRRLRRPPKESPQEPVLGPSGTRVVSVANGVKVAFLAVACAFFSMMAIAGVAIMFDPAVKVSSVSVNVGLSLMMWQGAIGSGLAIVRRVRNRRGPAE